MDAGSPLCQQCEQIVFDDATRDAVANAPGSQPWALTDTWPNLPSLHRSAAAGCTFCGYVAFILKEGKIPAAKAALSGVSGESQITVTLGEPAYVYRSSIVELVPGWEHKSRPEEPDGIWWLELWVSCEGFSRKWKARARVYRGVDDSVSAHLGIQMRKPAAYALSPECLDLTREWVQSCWDNHPQCQPRGPVRLPTRLIDIGADPTAIPRLVDGDSLQPSSRYFALSYCWGPPSKTKPQLTTTKATLPTRRGGIPLSTMPSTMQDFVALTHSLGVRYIWIDAVCIIQDDTSDWENEASLMFSVYRHASLTVVAAAGPSSHSGFLRRDPAPHAVVPFASRRRGGADVRGEYLLCHLGEYRVWDADNPSHMHGTAWAARAWTFQEDLLSTCVLYFNAETSYFRCQGGRRAENSALGYEPMLQWHDMLSPSAADADSADARAARDELYDRWDLLLTEYSERTLTVAGDKLPALSGLAQGFAAGLGGDEYVAGMWRGDLLHGLLWYITHDARETGGWRAPSWSWAARDGIVGTMAHSRPVLSRATIEEVCVVPRGKDPFGMLKDAWIVLRGPMRRVTLRPTVGRHSEAMAYADVMDSEAGAVTALGTVDLVAHSGLENDGTYRAADVGGFEALGEVWALLLCLTPTFDFAEDGETVVVSGPEYPAGILLAPKGAGGADGVVPVYKRVGMFRTNERDDLSLWEGLPEVRVRVE